MMSDIVLLPQVLTISYHGETINEIVEVFCFSFVQERVSIVKASNVGRKLNL